VTSYVTVPIQDAAVARGVFGGTERWLCGLQQLLRYSARLA